MCVQGVTCESTCPTQNELNDHDNSNDSTNTGEDNHELDLKTCDEWPPRDFDPLAPVELPFGPRNTSKRLQLTNMVGEVNIWHVFMTTLKDIHVS